MPVWKFHINELCPCPVGSCLGSTCTAWAERGVKQPSWAWCRWIKSAGRAGGKDYRFAPGARLNSNDSQRNQFSDFKLGDKIYFTGTVLNGVNYVDIIYYETPEPS